MSGRVSARAAGTAFRRTIDGLAKLRNIGLAAAALAFCLGSTAEAQQAGTGLVGRGNAVVTGFSGFIAGQAPAGTDPFDFLSINTDGASAEIVDLSTLGPQGQLSNAPKVASIPAAQVGQVFGVALDNAPAPNIYLAATSAYGLSIYLPDGSGTTQRIRVGTTGAQFIPGQFGSPELGGGPGSIWRVDGTTGEVLLFANIESAGVASLGGLAFDPGSQQLFAADRSTGIIHRFDLDGTEAGTYDHGIEGRPAAGLSPLPLLPTTPVDINAASFDTENPGAWGYASPARRVFALAVRDGRLYYSVAQGPQVWSVGIAASGALAVSPRFEVEAPALQDGVEISSIAFDGAGRMYLAERGATMGDYELTKLAAGGQARVLRFVPKPAGDPAPGLWRLQPDQYAIGLPAPYTNANGGVALGYGYQQNGAINYGACRATLWSTGERLLDPGDPSLPPDSYPAVDGLQGNSPSLIEPQNQPPTNAWYVDYDDIPGTPDFTGYMGAVTIYNPCAGQIPYTPPPPVVTCPPGTIFSGGQCVVIPTCPPGTLYKNGACVYPSCPPGYVLYKNQCVPPPLSCPPGFAFYNGKCVPLECPPGMQRMPNGQCICPVNNIFYNGQCVPPQYCPQGMVQYPNGVCWCPAGTNFIGGACIPNFCLKGYIQFNGKCVPEFCPPGFIKGPGGLCVPILIPCALDEIIFNGKCLPKKCPPFYELNQNGKCKPVFLPCAPNEIAVNGKCVPKKCPPLQQLGPNGQCQPTIIIDCQPGFIPVNGQCVPKKCTLLQQLDKNGNCVPGGIKVPPGKIEIPCIAGQETVNGVCVPVCAPDQIRNKAGVCVPAFVKLPGKLPGKIEIPCADGQEKVNGVCVPVCGADQIRNKAGVCVPAFVKLPGKLPGKIEIACTDGQEKVNGVCVPVCAADQIRNKAGVCVPAVIKLPGKLPADKIEIACIAGQEKVNGVCVPVCAADQIRNKAGVCVPAVIKLPGKLPADKIEIACIAGQEKVNGACVPVCAADQIRNKAGVCVAKGNGKGNNCGAGMEKVNGNCVTACPTGMSRNKKGICIASQPAGPAADQVQTPALTCADGQEMLNGSCVAKCAEGQVRNKKGKCVVPKNGGDAGQQ